MDSPINSEERDIVEAIDDDFLDRMLEINATQRLEQQDDGFGEEEEIVENRSNANEEIDTTTVLGTTSATGLMILCILFGMISLTGGGLMIGIYYNNQIRAELRIRFSRTFLKSPSSKHAYRKLKPIYLDLPGPFSGSVPHALSICFNLTSSYLYDSSDGDGNNNNNNDFYYKESFCGRHLQQQRTTNSHHQNQIMNKEKMTMATQPFILLVDPFINALSSFEDFIKKQRREKNHDSGIKRIYTIGRYLDSMHFKSNVVTRSLACKFDGELTWTDFQKAKNVLSNDIIFGLMANYSTSISSFQEIFEWGNKNNNRKKSGVLNVHQRCFKRTIHPGIHKFTKRQTSPILSVEDHTMINKILRYDIKLFSFAKESLR